MSPAGVITGSMAGNNPAGSLVASLEAQSSYSRGKELLGCRNSDSPKPILGADIQRSNLRD